MNNQNNEANHSSSTQKTLTLVSAFLSNVNFNEDRNIQKYIEYGKLLLESPLPKVIFIDQDIFQNQTYFSSQSYESTIFIPIQKTDLYLYDFLETNMLNRFHVQTDNPQKDTL